MSVLLNALTSASIEEQSRAVTAQILSLPAFQQARSVSCYLSMPSGELDTSSLVSEILRCGKTLFVPKIDQSKGGHMDFLKVYEKEDLDSFPRGSWGIKEPPSQWQGSPRDSALDERIAGLDIIFVPGVAFDRSFCRLGHGKGYYDHLIASFSSTKKSKPLLVALAFQEQVLEKDKVPIEPHDWSMDLIVTPKMILSKE
ncbi:putative 5-formyltetrahydrofolate cyclo-ligase [Termitomyces sp. J132]|nr:putative 5-formyltetrahydrofolate cyclo-ligase [Termitomyces sp. J132]